MPLASKLTRDESRAVAFVGLLLAVSAGARLLDRPAPLEVEAPQVDIDALEVASRERQALESPLGPGERLDPNRAPAEQLARLPGAGRAIAERIVAERGSAPFRSVEDLQRVRGVGPATIEKWRPHVDLPAASARTDPARTGRPEPAVQDRRQTPLDLNRATEAELERLPGIGPVLARRIIAWRDSAGGFRRVEQLEDVRGVGPAMMRRLAPLVRIGG